MEETYQGISCKDVLDTISGIKNFFSENPQVINAANHVVKNGIKQGGYDIVKSAVNGVLSSDADRSSLASTGQAALNGLYSLGGSDDSVTAAKDLGANLMNRCRKNNGVADAYTENCYDERYIEETSCNYERDTGSEQPQLPAVNNNSKGDMMTSVSGGITVLGGIKKAGDTISGVANGLEKINSGIQKASTEIQNLGRNAGELRNSVSGLRKSFGQSKGVQVAAEYADDAAEMLNYGFTESAVSGATSTLSKVGSSAAKGGLAGAAIGITVETVLSWKKYKNGEITKKEYIKEISKTGGQFGISGAASAGIVTALSVPLGAVGLAGGAVTFPLSIAVGAGIDKLIAPAFGRGEHKKLLDEAKYYNNIMDSYDDLVHAIEDTESQFADFIDEFQRQQMIHNQLKDTNRQIRNLHTVADNKINQQKTQINNTFKSLGNLYNNI